MTGMKIAKKDLALIMVIVGLLAAFCSYKFYFEGVLETVEAEDKKQEEKNAQIEQLEAKANEVNNMKKEVVLWGEEVTKILEDYDVFYKFEDGILWMSQIEKDTAKAGMPAVIQTYTVGEAGVSATVTGQGAFSGKVYNKGVTTYSFSYAVENYDALKNLIDYIVSGNDGVKTLDNMSFEVDPVTGETKGNIVMSVYILSDGTVAYEDPTIDGVNLGIPNIFGEPTGELEEEE